MASRVSKKRNKRPDRAFTDQLKRAYLLEEDLTNHLGTVVLNLVRASDLDDKQKFQLEEIIAILAKDTAEHRDVLKMILGEPEQHA
jgi:hypothetical protein